MIGADRDDPGTQFSGMDAASASNASTGSDQYNEGSWFEAAPSAPPAPSTPSESYVMSPEVRDVYQDFFDMHGGSADLLGPRTFDPYAREPVSPAGFLDRSPNYAYGMEDYPVDRVVTRPDFAPATQPTATAPERSIPNVTTDTSGRPQLEALVAAGLGNVTGLNPNNPDQTAQQLLNSFRANDFLTEYAPSLFTAGLPPGMAFAYNALRSGADIAAKRTTPGQALMGVGLEAAARAAGLPGGGPMLGDLLEGRVGPAAGRAASGLATGIAARAGLGGFAPMVLKEAGITPAISKSVSGAVQPQPGQGTGIVSALTNAINRGVKDITGMFGGTPSAPIPETPKVTTPTRAYVPPDYNLYESSSYEPPAAATAPTTPAATTPEVAATRRLLYGTAQGPYGPLLAYDFGEA